MIAGLIGTLVKPTQRSISATNLRMHERTRHFDYVTLADGTIVTVPHASLAAAKEALAAPKAAARRLASRRATAGRQH